MFQITTPLYSFSLIPTKLGPHNLCAKCQYAKNCGIDFQNVAFKIFGNFFKFYIWTSSQLQQRQRSYLGWATDLPNLVKCCPAVTHVQANYFVLKLHMISTWYRRFANERELSLIVSAYVECCNLKRFSDQIHCVQLEKCSLGITDLQHPSACNCSAFCNAVLCISVACAIMWWLRVCHIYILCCNG